ncbi:GNAT family N-acetyltransferase [Brooklawnia cerclae]|nr:GNAT family N-acetyltransferase [Brooklawnia cerclae]
MLAPEPGALERVLPGSVTSLFAGDDLAELVVLQRCCWVPQALVNETLDVPALRESHDEVAAWAPEWTTVVVRLAGRMVAAGRGRVENSADWQVGRLMVAPDLAGRGIGSVLIRVVESLAPAPVSRFVLYTGGRSLANIRFYQRAGYAVTPGEIPPGHIAGAVLLTRPRRAED